jgi:hypothetical protein
MAFGITLIILSIILFILVTILFMKCDSDIAPIGTFPLFIAIGFCVWGCIIMVSETKSSIWIEQQKLACGGNLGYFNQDGKFCSSNNTIIKMLKVVDPDCSPTIILEKN